MKRRLALIATMMFCSPLIAEPDTQPTVKPTTQPMDVWSSNELGKMIFKSFASAPFPHKSRADGFKNAAGKEFGPEHYQDSTVGIFVPDGFVPDSGAVDLVVYFHGHNNHVSQVIEKFALEQQIAKSGVNAILIVPQGPFDAPDSGGGKLELDDEGFSKLILEVLRYLRIEKITRTERPGNVALAAHSGGYKVTAGVLHRGGMVKEITDVILLDASYGGLEWFLEFEKAKPSARIISFHTEHLDKTNADFVTMLDKAGVRNREIDESNINAKSLDQKGVLFISTKLAHNDVPSAKDYLTLCLQSSQLEQRPKKN